MSLTSTNIKIDEELKKQAQLLFGEMGLTLTSAVNLFLSQSVREQAIPFKIALTTPNSATLDAIKEGDTIINSRKGRFDNTEEMFDDLGI